ncbi:MAG TPA: hypothetical protein ENI87_01810 [bacterium]|nr:hypothetical protein [bacterium]
MPAPWFDGLQRKVREDALACGHTREIVDRAFVKHDDGKPRWTLLPVGPLEEVIRVLMHGARVYGEDNWRKCPPGEARRYLDAVFRHLAALVQAEQMRSDGAPRRSRDVAGLFDADSGLHHAAHAVCCLLFYMEVTGDVPSFRHPEGVTSRSGDEPESSRPAETTPRSGDGPSDRSGGAAP